MQTALRRGFTLALNHENHEVRIMVAGLSPARPMRENSCQDETFPAVAAGLCDTLTKEIFMQWTTPTASDFRFGFEITMYVAAR